MHTKDFLAAELAKAGLNEMAAKAAEGYYHDYLSPLDLPSLKLSQDLAKARTPEAHALWRRHMDGEFDASKEESEAWAASPEGRETFAELTKPTGNRAQRRKAGERGRPRERLGDEPIEHQYRAMMNALARDLDTAFNGDAKGDAKETGFVLLVFPFGDSSGRCNFISNGADRRDIVVLFKEMIARFEGQPETSGTA